MNYLLLSATYAPQKKSAAFILQALSEELIKQETKATIRCIPLDAKEEDGVCLFSGNPSSQRVLFAKAY